MYQYQIQGGEGRFGLGLLISLRYCIFYMVDQRREIGDERSTVDPFRYLTGLSQVQLNSEYHITHLNQDTILFLPGSYGGSCRYFLLCFSKVYFDLEADHDITL